MTLLLFILGSFLTPEAAQDEKLSIWEAKYKHEKSLLAIPGVKRISIGGIGDQYHLVVSVDTEETGKKVLHMTGGELEGWPVHITYSKGKSNKDLPPDPSCDKCVCPCHKGGTTVVKPPVIDPNDPNEVCDLMRKLLKKKRRKGAKESNICRQMVGWTNDPRKIKWIEENNLPNWKSQEFGGFVIAYTYIKHRQECPLRNDTFLERVKDLTPGSKK